MAEGGEGEDPKENPFSFHKFMQKDKKSKTDKDDSEDTGDYLSSLPDVSNAGKKKAPTLIVTDDKPEQNKQKKKKSGDENPFSFKKFLESAGSNSKPKYAGNSPVSRSRTNHSAQRNTPDFANDLPDFVQDHFGDFGRERSSRDVELPDFALPSGGISDRAASPTSHRENSDDIFSRQLNGQSDLVVNSSHPQDRHVGNDRCSMFSNDDYDRGPENKSHLPTSLPDFLSDGIFNNAENCDIDHSSLSNGLLVHGASSNREGIAAFEINGDLELELRRLRDENRQLRLQLDEAKREAVTETQSRLYFGIYYRCHKMKKEMEVLQKKEAEDTAALERMVQQVEANLITTTSEDKGMSDIRDRTKYASEQLSAAATTAEQNLKY
ncbi:hypothetical protein KUTeg_019050 [Tegillarca granosa]|uniref:Endosome-associated-trafficking regulator 1 n=1 Tax=Tegillarca granosa TaxID=220873 RepID=A0ABQ9EDI3_TEGGR|nr:hypothetical protein KUTeg_019050 [Tegillarca granosa]